MFTTSAVISVCVSTSKVMGNSCWLSPPLLPPLSPPLLPPLSPPLLPPLSPPLLPPLSPPLSPPSRLIQSSLLSSSPLSTSEFSITRFSWCKKVLTISTCSAFKHVAERQENPSLYPRAATIARRVISTLQSLCSLKPKG